MQRKLGRSKTRRKSRDFRSRLSKRVIALLYIALAMSISIPPAMAASLVVEARSRLSIEMHSVVRRVSSRVAQQPVNENRGVRPRTPETKTEKENKVASLRINPSGHVRLESRQPMLFTAVPADINGNSVHGLHATWTSNDSQTLFIKPNGWATAGKPGRATLTATAGSASGTVDVVVVESHTREDFGGKKSANSVRIKRPSVQHLIVEANSARESLMRVNRPSRRKVSSQPRFNHRDIGVETSFVLPQQPPTENPLPDDETNSLYQPGNLVGSPPGK